MANTPTKSSGLPPIPQAPSFRSSAPRHRSDSAEIDYDKHGKSSRRSKGSNSRSRRARSSSDGVRVMNQRYHHQQQGQNHHYLGQGGGYGQISNYPMQQSNKPLPPGPGGYTFQPPLPSPRSHTRHTSFDGSKLAPFGMDSDSPPNYNYGSIPPRPRTRSKEFSAMNELSSVVGHTGGGSGSSRTLQNPRSGGMRRGHRRVASDSMVAQQQVSMPALFQGNRPPHDTNYQGGLPIVRASSGGAQEQPSLMRTGSYGSQTSHEQNSSRVYASENKGEREALLAQQMEGGVAGLSLRPNLLMRENSANVNNFMKSCKGEKQPKSCKDVLFGMLFLTKLAVMFVAGAKFGPQALVMTSEELGPGEGMEDDDIVDYNSHVLLAYQNIIKMASMCGAFAMIVSALALAFMVAMSRRLVYVALVMSIGVSFVWGTIGIGISPNSFVPVTGIVALMLTVGYMFVVWDRIPFASANLTTALTGVRDNLGLVGVALFFQFLALLTSIYFCFTYVGLRNAMLNGQLANLSDSWRNVVLSLLVVSYLWTYQVLRHIVMVTVAGTIGSWWFRNPSALKETFTVATVYNFGSICHGSLLIGIVQVLRQFTEGLRPHHEGSSMMCLYECSVFFQGKIVGCVDILADTLTPWAYPYVGLYHYGLKEAGHKANELFDKRGWSRIVTDDLITSVLFLCSLVIGGVSGCFSVMLQILDSTGLTSFGHPVYVSFMIGFMIGIVLSAVLFSIIDSSVSAVIVCFAGSPVEFHNNHPELSREMRFAWKEVWPGSLDIDSFGIA